MKIVFFQGYDHVPLLAFFRSCLLAFCTAFWLPETAGVELPVTIREAEERDNSPTVEDVLKCRNPRVRGASVSA